MVLKISHEYVDFRPKQKHLKKQIMNGNVYLCRFNLYIYPTIHIKQALKEFSCNFRYTYTDDVFFKCSSEYML